MIELTARDIGEFQKLYKQETGKDISEEEARDYAERLIAIVAFVARSD